MENKIYNLEEKINQLEKKYSEMEDNFKNLLSDRILILETQMNLLKEKQEKENTLFYEHLQFMNYSQKIKNVENEIRDLKLKISQKDAYLSYGINRGLGVKPFNL